MNRKRQEAERLRQDQVLKRVDETKRRQDLERQKVEAERLKNLKVDSVRKAMEDQKRRNDDRLIQKQSAARESTSVTGKDEKAENRTQGKKTNEAQKAGNSEPPIEDLRRRLLR